MSMDEQKGFTLVELLITMVVVSILLATGVPSFMQFIKNNRVTGQANSFVVSTHMARNEAVKRGISTILCAANADMDGCSNVNNWSTGWIVFSDLDRDGVIDSGTNACLEDEDCLLRTANPPQKSTLTTASDSEIRFLPTGQTDNLGEVTFFLEAVDCDQNQKRSILITRQGHTTMTEQPCTP
jgi:type IV fimbrial biogenesis protein FimT